VRLQPLELLMTTVGLLASIGPARRGLAVQPTEALREEYGRPATTCDRLEPGFGQPSCGAGRIGPEWQDGQDDNAPTSWLAIRSVRATGRSSGARRTVASSRQYLHTRLRWSSSQIIVSIALTERRAQGAHVAQQARAKSSDEGR
jgi:hypothetical protein